MRVSIFCFTLKGAGLCERIRGIYRDVQCYSKYASKGDFIPMEESLSSIVKKAFHSSDTLVFIGAAGIAVRLIAPFITSKDKDPAVIVIDEKCSYVIPILSGHLGGANQAACELAEFLKAQPVITTATDVNQVFAVDTWAKEQGLFIHDIKNIKYISSAILRGEKIGFSCDYEVEGILPEIFIEAGMKTEADKADAAACIPDTRINAGILISEDVSRNLYRHTLHLIPRHYVAGIGCRKNIEAAVLEAAVISCFKAARLSPELLTAAATIDIKAKEPAITAFCRQYRINLITYSGEELKQAEGVFTSSDFVRNTVGVDNVCERAAFLASGRGEILLRKTSSQGVTVAIAKKKWRCRF